MRHKCLSSSSTEKGWTETVEITLYLSLDLLWPVTPGLCVLMDVPLRPSSLPVQGMCLPDESGSVPVVQAGPPKVKSSLMS